MPAICTAKDCGKAHLAKGYCTKHYYRMKRGHSVEAKTRFDIRPVEIVGDIARIELANGKGYATVDIDETKVQRHNWCLSGDGYPMTYISGALVKLHHFVVGKPPKGLVTDHINRDRLDNRKSNLRFVTQRENLLNGAHSVTVTN